MRTRQDLSPTSWYGLLNLLMYVPDPYYALSMRRYAGRSRHLVEVAPGRYAFDERLMPGRVAAADCDLARRHRELFYPSSLVSPKIVRRLLRRGFLERDGATVRVTPAGVRAWDAERRVSDNLGRYPRYSTWRLGTTLTRYRRRRLREGLGTAAALERLNAFERRRGWFLRCRPTPAPLVEGEGETGPPRRPWRRRGWMSRHRRRLVASRDLPAPDNEVDSWTSSR